MYGSFRQDQRLKESYLDHTVLPGETIQGIALKYGSSTEGIKRVNNLWTNDSLALKKHLFIPIPVTDGNVAAKPATPDVTGLGIGAKSADCSPAKGATALPNGHAPEQSDSDSERTSNSQPSEQLRPSATDFFSKFDANVAQIKSNVDRLESESSLAQCPGLMTPPARRTLRHAASSSSTSSDDPFGYPTVQVKGRAQSKNMAQHRTDTEDRFYEL